MAEFDKFKNDDEEDSGSGGKSGAIEFHDFLASSDQRREDFLPLNEEKRMLIVHESEHKEHVKKQKLIQENRKASKDGKFVDHYQQGLHSGMHSQYAAHRILQHKAQFSGSTDDKVNALPTNQIANTNEGERNELENKFRKRYLPEQKFVPPQLKK